MNTTLRIAPVKKSVLVAGTPQQAFEVFTAGIDRWWPKQTHSLGKTPAVASVIEPRQGGRWYTRHEDGSECVVGHVRVWEPGARLVIGWEISPDWKPDARTAFASEVEVRFVAQAGGTRVELEHRDFERLGAEGGAKMRRDVDGGWPTILELYAKQFSAASNRS
jgi:uncharacterized protein YndB with AHSA1/START domain